MRMIAIAITLVLAACSTTYQCEQQALKAPYGLDPVENILLHDDAIRACEGREPRR